MKTCIKCGGNAYRDADTYCAHDFGEPPEPDHVSERTWPLMRDGRNVEGPDDIELGFWAHGVAPGGNAWRGPWIDAEHPTREGAIAAWKERWRWGHALVALFRWMLTPPPIVVTDDGIDPERKREIIEALDRLGSEWTAPILGATARTHAFGRALDTHAREFFARHAPVLVGEDPGSSGGDRAAYTLARRADSGVEFTEARRFIGEKEGDRGNG